jgi:hypothetical protein
MNYADTVEELRRGQPELAERCQSFDGVTQVVDWLETLPAKPTIDFVSHDEFSYDFLIHLDEQRWLAFGVN